MEQKNKGVAFLFQNIEDKESVIKKALEMATSDLNFIEGSFQWELKECFNNKGYYIITEYRSL